MSSSPSVSTPTPDSVLPCAMPSRSASPHPLWLRVSGGLFAIWVVVLVVLTITSASRGQIIPRQIRLSDAVVAAVVSDLKADDIHVEEFWAKNLEQEKTFSTKKLRLRNLREVVGLRNGSHCLIPLVKVGTEWVIPGWEGAKSNPVVYADTPENRKTVRELLSDQ